MSQRNPDEKYTFWSRYVYPDMDITHAKGIRACFIRKTLPKGTTLANTTSFLFTPNFEY